MPCGHLNAMRFAQNPLGQPAYAFCHVPKATGSSSLPHSQVQKIDNREHFQACMAEMLLLGKEAVRRRATASSSGGDASVVETNSAAKPLSLEYLADRMDVDDPCFGFLVRTKTEPPSSSASTTDTTAMVVDTTITDSNSENNTSTTITTHDPTVPPSTISSNSNDSSHWKEGMLQGFITVTTFTNWQATFQWDSLHPDAFCQDPPALKRQRLKLGTRKWDHDGSLSTELQATVHSGDVWDEGIVWPRIAEISLLGGLGCGRTLVKLALEQLERLKASDSQNYDYVVLQATDNSIPFYESMGFVRVGGIMADKPDDKTADANNGDGDPMTSNFNGVSPTASTVSSSSSDDEARSNIVTSDSTTYTTKKRGEQPIEIAKKLRVSVWDVLFLNRGLFVDPVTPTSKLLLGTTVQVPAPQKKERKPPSRVSSRLTSPVKAVGGSSGGDEQTANQDTTSNSNTQNDNTDLEETPTWFVAKENDTPTKIAKMFHVNCQELIRANANRLPGLIPKSRLRNGTRVQVSHFHIRSKKFLPYSHWSFPDNEVEDGEPSYMMCYKLQPVQDGSVICRRLSGASTTETSTTATTTTSLVDSLENKIVDYTPTPLLWMPESAQAKKDSAALKTAVDTHASDAAKKIQCKSLAPIMEAAASTPSPNQGQPPIPSTPSLMARNTSNKGLIQVRIVSEGHSVQPSPIVPQAKLSSKTPAASTSPDNDDFMDTPASELKPPKRHLGSFVLFCQDMRKRKAQLLQGLTIADASRVLADRWQKAPPQVKQGFEKLAAKGKKNYLIEKEEYDRLLAIDKEKQACYQHEQQFQRRDSVTSAGSGRDEVQGAPKLDAAGKKKQDHDALYNKIVKVKPEAMPFTVTPRPKGEALDKDGNPLDDPTSSPELQPPLYEYWFVLTYIPDLQWCHLVPLVKVGEFTAEDKKIRLIGRSKWKLVDESLCQEIDISSRYVVPVKSRETKRSADADKEEWDIIEQGEEDAISEEGSRSSSRKATGGKRGKKRSKPAPSSKSTSNKKRAYNKNTLADQSTPVIMETPNQNMGSAIAGANCKWAPPMQVTLPPMKLNLSAIKPTNLHHGGETISTADESGSPSSPGRYQQDGPNMTDHHHHPQYGFMGGHPYQNQTQQEGAYPYGPPPGYHHPHEQYRGPPFQQQQQHYHRPPPPPPGWPRQVPFPPPEPYQAGQHHFEAGPPSHHYQLQPQNHYPEQPPPQYYQQQSFPVQPQPAVGTPCGNRTSSSRLALSVERECAI